MHHLVTFLGIIRLVSGLSLLYSMHSVAEPNQQAAQSSLTDFQQKQLDLLSSEINEADIKWLTSEGKTFLSLWQPDQTGNPFGALLILHGNGQSLDDPYEISAIRNNLAQHGWATLAIHLPATAKKAIPPRPDPVMPKSTNPEGNAQMKEGEEEQAETGMESSTSKKEDTSKKAMETSSSPMEKEDPEKIVKARMDAAVTFLKEQGQYNIVIIGHGISANRAMRYIDILSGGRKLRTQKKRKIKRPFRAAVLVAARNQTAISTKRIDDYFNDPGLPVLDITYGEHYMDQTEIRQRAKTARAAGIRDYFQIKMLRPTGVEEDYENRLTRRIRGFLNTHAKGVEIERRQR